MSAVEPRWSPNKFTNPLVPLPEPEPHSQPVQEGEREQLLALAEPELSLKGRLEIVFQIRGLLSEPLLVQQDQVGILAASEWIPPPVSPAFIGAQGD